MHHLLFFLTKNEFILARLKNGSAFIVVLLLGFNAFGQCPGFNVDAGNGISICQYESAVINSSVINVPINSVITYLWTNDSNGYTSTLADPTFNNLSIGTYIFTVTATANGCIDTDQIQVIVNPNPPILNPSVELNGISINPNTYNGILTYVVSICNLASGANIASIYNNSSNGDNANYFYSTTSQPPVSILSGIPEYLSLSLGNNYFTIAKDLNGCSSNKLCNIIVNEVVSSISPTIQGLCLNGVPNPISVSYSGGTGTPTYQWYSNTVASNTNGTLISGGTSSSYYPPTNATGSKYYYCIISLSGSGCSVNSSVSRVIVNLTPSLTSMGFVNQTLCLGGTASSLYVEPFIGGYGTPTYQWYSNTSNSYTGGTMLAGETSQTFIPQTNTIGSKYYYCQVTYSANGCGTVNSPISLVSVLADPVISTQPLSSQTICTGGSTAPLSFVASGGIGTFSYQWYSNSINSNVGGIPITGQTSATLSLGALTNIATTYYYSTISQTGNGCTSNSTNTSSVTVIADPVVTVTPTLQQACIGGVLAPLIVSSTGGSGTSQYQWYYNTTGSNISGTLISGATSPTLSVSTTASLNRYYYCVITRSISGCTVNSAVAQVIINSAPAINSQPTPAQGICVGGTTNPMCVDYNYGTSSPNYQWYSNTSNTNTGGSAIPGANSNCYTPLSTTAGTTYYYAIISFTGSGCSSITSNTAVAEITPDPVINIQPINFQTICVGGITPTPLSVSYEGGTGTPIYQWFDISDSPILGATNNTYVPSGLIPGQFESYYATIYLTGSGCDVLTSYYSNIQAVSIPSISIQPLASQTICQGGTSAPLTVEVQAGIGPFTFQWYSNTTASTFGGTVITGANNNTYTPPVFNTAGTYYYYCVITDAGNGCGIVSSQLAAIIVSGPALSQPFFFIPSNGCPESTISISGFSPSAGNTYSWHISPNQGANLTGGNTSSPNITFSNGGNYNLYVTENSSNGCSTNSNVQSISIASIPIFQPDVQVNGIDVMNNLNDTTYAVCGSTSIGSIANIYTFNFPFDNIEYYFSSSTQQQTPILDWEPQELNLNNGNNFFTITGTLNGCSVGQTYNIYAGSIPYVTTAPSNSVGICTGQTVNFAIATIDPSTNSPNSLGTTYTFGVSDVPSSLPNIPNSTPFATFMDINGYQNVPYTFATSSCGQNPGTVLFWSTGGTPIFTVFPANTFYAVIQASNACGTTTTSSVSPIVVSSTPAANFTVTQTTICTNSTVTITNTGISGNAVSSSNNQAPFTCTNTGKFFYTISPSTGWTVSTGTIGAAGVPASNWSGVTTASNNAIITFSSAGTYTITQKYQNGCGTSTLQKTICVVAPPTCAFTPSPLSGCTVLPVSITNNTTGPSCDNTPLPLSYNWTVTNPTGGTSTVSTATSVSPSISLTNNTTGILTFPMNVVVNPLIIGTTTPVANCSSTCTQSVIVYPQPTFTTQPQTPASVCLGGTFNVISVVVNYLGTGTPTYQWYSNTTASSTGGILITGATSASYVPPATAVGTIYYYCVVTFPNNTNCNQITSNNVPAIVVPDPQFSIQPLATQTICTGSISLPLTVAIQGSTGIGAFTYQWYSNSSATNSGGTIISGATASTYSPPVFNTSGNFYFYCVVTNAGNGCGTIASQVSSISVVAYPSISTQPISVQNLCQNVPAAPLTISASGGTGTFLYQWYINTANNTTSGTLITGANSFSYNPSTSANGTFYYYCIVSNAASGCPITSTTSAVIVNFAPTFITQPLGTQSVCIGGATTTLNVAYTYGAGTASYQWYANSANTYAGGTAIPGQTTASYTPPSSVGSTFYYYCIISFSATSGCSMINSNISEVVILSNLQTASITPATAASFCQGGSIVLNANTGSGLTYQWKLNGTNIAGATSASYTTNTIGSYTVVVTNTSSCSATSTATVVTVNALPAATITPATTTTFCQGASVVLNANTGTGLTYQWKLNGTNIAGATSSSYTANASGSYTVAVTNASSCSATSNATVVTVNALPAATITPATTTTFCQGGSVVLNANTANGLTYQWYLNGTVITGATSASYTANASGSYTVVVTNASSCSATSNATVVTVNALPTATITPATTTTFCQGGSVTLNANTGSGLTYQWKLNGTNITGATSSSYTANASGSYTVVVTNASSCSATSTASVVTVNALPTATITPATTTTFCQGGTVALNANTGTGLTYQWKLNGANITGATLASYTANASGSYTVVVTNTSSCSATSTATVVTVHALPTATITPASATTFCQGSSVILNANTGTGLTYQWKLNGANITGATSASYTANASGAYSVVVTNSNFCSSTSVDLTVNVTTQPSISSQPTANQTICVGGTPEILSVSLLNTAGTPEYQWWSNTTNSAIGASQITGATSSTYVPATSNIGVTFYFCVVSFTSSNCGYITSNISSVNIVEDPYLSIQPLALQSFCVGGTANTLSVIASGGTGTFSYQWYNALTNSAIFGANSITFTPGTFNSVSNNSYYVQVTQTGSGCNTMISNNAQVNIVADPIAVISSGSTYCQNSGNVNPLSIILISGGEGTPSYQWYSNTTGGNTAGNPIAGATGNTYTPPVNTIGNNFYYCSVTQTGFNCAANSAASQILVTTAPTFSIQPASSQSVCVGGVTTQLHVEYINGTGTPTYQWYSNTTSTYTGGTAIPSATSSIYNVFATDAGTTYYFCSISFPAGGCSTIFSNIASVNIYPDAIIAQQPLTSQVICNGGAPIPITATIQPSTGMGAFSYQWFRNDTPLNTGGTLIANATNATYYPPSSSYSYYCLITDGGNGCGSVTSEVATVTKVPDPIITEEINFIQTICPYESIINAPTVMVNFAPEIAPPIYTWFEVDLNGYTPIPNSNNNSYTPENLSNNLVQTQCTIEFNYPGCDVLLSSLSKLIFDEKGIDCYPNLDIPGAISPNNDGANDYWTISEIELYSGYEINIFNSFGQSIYQVKNTPANWDGTWDGQNLPNGDYFYAIKLLELNRTIFGTISLVR